jgi:hypothetical protein
MEMEFILSTKIKLFTKEISVRAKNKAWAKWFAKLTKNTLTKVTFAVTK